MALMRVEDRGSIPVTLEETQQRLPGIMKHLGYEQVSNDAWQRRKECCGSGVWSLPDACPATLHLTLTEEVDAQEHEARKVRYVLLYEVKMPGQILANTDRKALELELDRLLQLLQGKPDLNIHEERQQLVKLTLLANLFLSLIPAIGLVLTVYLTRNFWFDRSFISGLACRVGIGFLAWGISLIATAKLVIRFLNSKVQTRLTQR